MFNVFNDNRVSNSAFCEVIRKVNKLGNLSAALPQILFLCFFRSTRLFREKERLQAVYQFFVKFSPKDNRFSAFLLSDALHNPAGYPVFLSCIELVNGMSV